jgi:hypothetical protein
MNNEHLTDASQNLQKLAPAQHRRRTRMDGLFMGGRQVHVRFYDGWATANVHVAMVPFGAYCSIQVDFISTFKYVV